MNKPLLYMLSDIFGTSEEDWMKEYKDQLSPYFEIVKFDSRELASIHLLPQGEVHGAFVKGGIDSAVDELITNHPKPDAIVGFSVGGTIAWKYAQRNPKVRLYLVSATRIRNEEVKPVGPITLYFGELEEHGPASNWFEKHGLITNLIPKDGHECYKTLELITLVSENLKQDFQLG